MQRAWTFQKVAPCGKIVDKVHVLSYGGVTLCFARDGSSRQFTSPDAARTQLAVEGFSLVENIPKQIGGKNG